MKSEPIAVFRLGNICLKILRTAPMQHAATIEKLYPADILADQPHLAHMFTPQDISAIRKLTREAEDAFFNFQSILLEHPQAGAQPPSKEELAKMEEEMQKDLDEQIEKQKKEES